MQRNKVLPNAIVSTFLLALSTFSACTKEAKISDLNNPMNTEGSDLAMMQPPPSCTTTKPGGLKESYNVVSNTCTFQWNAIGGATGYEVWYLPASCDFVGPQPWGLINTATNSAQVPLNDYSLYIWKVRPVCPAGTGTFSSARTFTTFGDALLLRYCQSSGTASSHWIEGITLNNLTRFVSGNLDGGYYNGTAMTATLQKGTTYTVQYNPEYTSAAYNQGQTTCHWKMYIDYNNNNSFDPSKCEEVVSATSNGSGTFTSSFTIPTWAPDGETRLRISMKFGGFPTPCEQFGSGEVEDYTVNLIP